MVPWIQRWLQGENHCGMMADNTGHGLWSRVYRNAHPTALRNASRKSSRIAKELNPNYSFKGENEELKLYVLWGRYVLYMMLSVTDCFTEVLSWSLRSLVIARYFKIMHTIIHIFNYHITMTFKHFLLKSRCWLWTMDHKDGWGIMLLEVALW